MPSTATSLESALRPIPEYFLGQALMIEYVTTGRLTLPIPEPHGSMLRDVRHGKYTRGEVLAMADANEAALESMASAAPREPDTAAINDWLLDCHRAQLP